MVLNPNPKIRHLEIQFLSPFAFETRYIPPAVQHKFAHPFSWPCTLIWKTLGNTSKAGHSYEISYSYHVTNLGKNKEKQVKGHKTGNSISGTAGVKASTSWFIYWRLLSHSFIHANGVHPNHSCFINNMLFAVTFLSYYFTMNGHTKKTQEALLLCSNIQH